MAITNENLWGIDRPVWEQLSACPVSLNTGGGFMVSDDERYLYVCNSATLQRYDTWTDVWLTLPGSGLTMVDGSALLYTKAIGTQRNGIIYGSLYQFVAGGTAAMRRYDIATNTWSGSLAVPSGAFGTDADLVYPSPWRAGFSGGTFHASAITTVTVTQDASMGSNSITADVSGGTLAAGAVLNFGTEAAPIWAVLTAGASSGIGVLLSVAPLLISISSGASAYWYDHMYFTGNASSQLRRYSMSGNAWHTTSANPGNPAFPALPAAQAAGGAILWIPGATDGVDTPVSMRDALVIARGSTTTNTIWLYDMQTNAYRTWNASTTYPYNPAPAVYFSSATQYVAVVGKNAQKQPSALLIQPSLLSRWYTLDFAEQRLHGFGTNNVQGNSTAITGNKACRCLTPDGMEFLYSLQSNTVTLTRCPVFLP